MRRIAPIFVLAILLAAILLPIPAHAAGCDDGRFHNADGSITAQCYVVTADVRGYACAPLAFIDGGGIGASTARQVAEREARIACAAEASHALYGEVYRGVFAADGGDAFTIRPDAVRVLSVERR